MIWGVCRGLGWTLDSERASALIRTHLTEVVMDANQRTEEVRRLVEVRQAEIKQLKEDLVARGREIGELKRAITVTTTTQGKVHDAVNEAGVPIPDGANDASVRVPAGHAG
jgi:hypothetical protein